MRRLGPWSRAALVAGTACGLLVAGVLAAWLWSTSDSGSRWVGRQILGFLNETFHGRIEAGEIAYLGSGKVTAEQLRVLGPDGTEAATAGHATAILDVRAALRGDVVLTVLRVEGLSARLYPGPDGTLPVIQAFTPRGSGDAVEEESTGGELRFERIYATVDHLEYGGARGEPPAVVVGRGMVRGSLRVDDAVSFDAEARALLTAPVQGPAQVRASGRVRDGRLEFDELRATLPGGIEIEGAEAGSDVGTAMLAAAAPTASGHGSVPAEPLDVQVEIPRDGLKPYGGPELAGPVRISAQLRARGRRISFAATASPDGPGSILADGWYERGEPGSFEATLDLRGVDPASLHPSLPEGRVRLALEASGRLAFPPSASLRGTARLSASALSGVALGPGRASFAVQGERWSFTGLELELPGANLSGDGAGGGAEAYVGEISLGVDDAAELEAGLRRAGLDPPELAWTLEAKLEAGGRSGCQELALTARSPSFAVAGTQLRAVKLEASLAAERLEVSASARLDLGQVAVDLAAQGTGAEAATLEALALRLPGSSWELAAPARLTWGREAAAISGLVLEGPGKLELDLRLADRAAGLSGPIAGKLRASSLSLSAFGPPLTDLRLAGAASGEIELAGTGSSPRFEGEVSVARLEVEVTLLGALRATFDLDARSLEATAELRPEASTAIALSAGLAARRGRPLWSEEGLRTARGELRARLRQVELASLAWLAVGKLRGTVGGEATLELPLDDPSLRARLEFEGLEQEGLSLPPLNGVVTVESDQRGVGATFEGRPRGFPAFDGSARVGASLRALVAGRSLKAATLEGRLSMGPGAVDYEREGLTAASLQAAASLSGTVGEPVASVEGRLEGIGFRGRSAGNLSLDVTVDAERAEGELRLDASEGGSLLATGEYEFDSEDWSARLEASRASADLLELLPQIESVEGSEIDGRLEASGGGEGAKFNGELSARARQLALPDYGLLRGVRLSLGTDGTSLTIGELAFEAGGGRVGASGSLDWGERDWRLRLRAALEALPVPTAVTPLAALTTRLDARVERSGERVSGEVRLSRGEVRFPDVPGGRELHPVELPAEIVVHEPRAPPEPEDEGPSAIERWLAQKRTRIEISIPRDFFVRSPMATAELSAELTGDWSRDALVLLGVVKAHQGEVRLASSRFEIRRFEARFTGAPGIDPALDGLLGYQTRETEVEVLVGGTLSEPTVEFRSDPPLDSAQVAVLLATGGPGAGGAVNPEQLALSGALNVVAGEVRDALAAALPLDVLEFELGPRGEAERLEAGTYVTPRLFVAFVRNLFARQGGNLDEVIAEYQLRRSISLRLRYGDRQSGSFEIFWERAFRSPAQRGGAREQPTRK